MKALINLLFLLLAFIPFSFAKESAQTSVIEGLPPCALSCLIIAVGQSSCELTNQTCTCTNAPLQGSVEACVLRNCTVKEGLTTKNITMSTCGAHVRNRVDFFRKLNIIFGVISAACVLLRVAYKLVLSTGELGWDDYFIVITLISGVPSTILTDRGVLQTGLGRDIWTLQFSQITTFLRLLYVMEILYFAQLALLKLSLLFFYARIFPARAVKRVIWATIAFDILFGVAFVLTGIFQCRPISYSWNSWDGEHSGKCINLNALAWVNAAVSIVLDIWMLAIPLFQLVNLKLAWKKKVGVAMMFFVGTFVTIVSILRLHSIVHFASSTNPTWDQWDLSVWSTVEINVGIMCACMPAIRVILVHLFPKVPSSTKNASNQYYTKYGSRTQGTGQDGNNSNAISSHTGKKNSVLGRERNIMYTRTFEVHHEDSDEVRLVQMDYLNGRGKVRSSNPSEISL